MFRDGISFGIDTESGVPYVSTCRGRFEFGSVENAAGCLGAYSRSACCVQGVLGHIRGRRGGLAWVPE
jgi:hypothetical protein